MKKVYNHYYTGRWLRTNDRNVTKNEILVMIVLF
jgi:hypothetical protein